MTTTPPKDSEPKKILGKTPSPFSSDPHNNRSGKKGKKGSSASGSVSGFKNSKQSNVAKFKGGSGGDR